MDDDGLHDEEVAARARLATLAPALPSSGWDRATWIPSNSNEVWRLDDVVLRVCWRGDVQRLMRESVLVDALPATLLAPTVLDTGEHDGLTWQLARRVEGTVLQDLWLDMDLERLRSLIAQLSDLLRELHAWTPPHAVRRALAAREGEPRHLGLGANLLPLPVPHALDLVETAARLAHVDAALMHAVERRIVALGPVDPFAHDDEPGAVVHGDAQLSNLIVGPHGIAALLDYEWCRMAPIDAELLIWWHVLRVEQTRVPGRTLPPVVQWLREDYPELFAAPDLEDRLWLYTLVFGVQGLLIWEPDRPERDLDPGHHLHELRRLVDRPPLRGMLSA